jgi:hypothetical protein
MSTRAHPRPDDTSARQDAAVRRYRAATDDVLQQLDWCIGYLYGLGKKSLSRSLARNRDAIRARLRDTAPR